ncbi:hypothetical protein LBMAG36_18940 [Chlorobiota bacterium]|nr:hypothetical protein LBMAG36_18940 [Chlorobiota bacterium]
MNEQFEKLIYKSGLTAQGCWDEMDSYMHDAIKQFAELIVRECAEICLEANDHKNILRHFGVE